MEQRVGLSLAQVSSDGTLRTSSGTAIFDAVRPLSAEAVRILAPYLISYKQQSAKYEEYGPTEPSERVPKPLVDGPGEPATNFTNQGYLGGGKEVPYEFLPGKAAPSPAETAAGTRGHKHPAMILGLPMSEETGASPIARVVSVKDQVRLCPATSTVRFSTNATRDTVSRE